MRSQGIDVLDGREQGWQGASDKLLLNASHGMERVVLTHDADFGRLAIAQDTAFTGVLYLRPGHIKPEFVIGMLQAVLDMWLSLLKPLLVVAQRSGDHVRVRVRLLQG